MKLAWYLTAMCKRFFIMGYRFCNIAQILIKYVVSELYLDATTENVMQKYRLNRPSHNMACIVPTVMS